MLNIALFGTPLITLDGAPVTGFVSQRSLALLAYLAVEAEQPHARVTLAETFWPDQPENIARKNLRDILFNLQKILRNQTVESPYLLVTRQTVQFNPHSPHSLDTRQFTALLTTCETHRHKKTEACRSCAARRGQAVALYRGAFLSGVNVDNSAVFEHWLALDRERLQQAALEALNHLTHFHARRREFAQARQYALRQVALAPWLESAYRQLMLISAWMGQRGAALAHFETCRQRLAQELDVPPSPETLTLYEAIKAGQQPLKFSSLTVTDPPPHHLPAQTTAFLGRAQEQLTIADYLQDPECRLLTLIGPGGCGKTRLAVQISADEFANFAQGIFFVPLATVESATSLPLVLAESINLPLSGQKPPQEQIINYLREKELLLVLDNFETLLGNDCKETALSLLIDILRYAPQVVMLVTSRQPVGLQAERLFNLEGLSYPTTEFQGDPDHYEAVQFYIERARRVQPDYVVDSENLATVAAICQLTEGLPLGLELAAAWARQMSAVEILMAVQKSLDALATTHPDIPARHRSIRAAFASSWAMLTPKEQRSFCALSVFRGGFTAQAASAVAVTQKVISALVDQSLLRQDENDRYQMHELLRQFGEEKLGEDPQAKIVTRNNHSAWVADFLQEWEPHLQGGRQLEALDYIQREMDNVRAGWHWILLQRKKAAIAQAAPAIAQFLDLRGWFQEGIELLGQAVAVLSTSGILYGRLLAYQASFTYRVGDYDQARDLFEQSLVVFYQIAAPQETAFAHNGLASIATNRGQYDEAKQHAKQGLEIARQTREIYEQAKSQDILGIVARYEGNLPASRTYFHTSLQLYQQLGNQFGLVRSLNYLGNTAMIEGAYEEAQSMFQQAMEISQAIDYRFLTAYLLNNLGGTAGYLKQYAAAVNYYEESLSQFHDLGDQFGVGLAQYNLGDVNLLMGNRPEAQKWFRIAMQAGLEMDSMALVTGALTGLATLSAQAGQKALALELIAFILNHPATRVEAKRDAEALQAELLAALSPKQAAAAQSGGKAASLTDIMGKVL